MTIYSDYDRFAWVYNRHWGNEFTPRVFPILENLVLRRTPAGGRILDLCCGTGQMAQTLTALGYRVTGIDGSAEMLRFARENAPDAQFVRADARSFDLPDRYDALVSVFDSLNHVMTVDELGAVFRNVRQVLAPGGLFFFDLSMEPGFSLMWNDNFGIVEDDLVCVVRTSYSPEERVARFDTTIFVSPAGWERIDLTLLQRCHHEAEVRVALEGAGFGEVEAYALHERRGLVEYTEDAERAYFLCRKPL